ncbi:hypothetical protein [Bordetella sp. 2513F-2]
MDNFLDVVPGTRIVLLNGAQAVVTYNPEDGLWLFARYTSHPTHPELVDGTERSIFAHDVKELLP